LTRELRARGLAPTGRSTAAAGKAGKAAADPPVRCLHLLVAPTAGEPRAPFGVEINFDSILRISAAS